MLQYAHTVINTCAHDMPLPGGSYVSMRDDCILASRARKERQKPQLNVTGNVLCFKLHHERATLMVLAGQTRTKGNEACAKAKVRHGPLCLYVNVDTPS